MGLKRTTDFVYALRIINILTTPWKDQEAYKHGIIDENGKLLRKYSDLKTSEEKDSFTYLHRIVFNLKRLLATTTGGDKLLATATASILLLKEHEIKDVSEDEWGYLIQQVEMIVEEGESISGSPTNNVDSVGGTEDPVGEKGLLTPEVYRRKSNKKSKK